MKHRILAVIIFLIYSHGFYAQLFPPTAESSYKLLKRGKYEKAYIGFLKVLQKDTSSFICKYGLALLYVNDNFDNHDLDSAYKYANIASKHLYLNEFIDTWSPNLNKRELRFLFKNSIIPLHVINLKDSIVELYAKNTSIINNTQKYNEFIKKFPQNIYAGIFQTKIFQLDFDSALIKNSIDAYQNYINKYPLSEKVKDCENKIFKLKYSAAISANTIKGYEDFINEYPTSHESEIFKDSICSLSFQDAVSINTIECYNSFIIKYPAAKQTSNCLKRIEDLSYFEDKNFRYHITDTYSVEVFRCINIKIEESKNQILEIPSYVINLGVKYSVTAIGDNAFKGYYDILDSAEIDSMGSSSINILEYPNNIMLPTTIKRIGYKAFYGCKFLTKISIPTSVTTIKSGAFGECSNLMSINLSSTISTIESSTFFRCSSLKSIIIPNSVRYIEDSAFYGCSNLISIEIPPSVDTIGNAVFSDCYKMQSITIPSSTKMTIGYRAFVNCSNLTSIKIPSTDSIIGEEAFYGCKSLNNITIPTSITTIEPLAFYGCTKLFNITLPKSVISIGYKALHNTAWFLNQPDGLIYAGSVLYSDKGKMPLNYNLQIIKGTKSIADNAFENHTNLNTLFIPNTVNRIGSYAFNGCSNLINVTIPSTVTYIGKDAFKNTYNNYIASEDSTFDSFAAVDTSSVALDFNTDNNLIEFNFQNTNLSFHSLNNCQIENRIDAMRIKITGNDPYLISSTNLNIDANVYNKIDIKIKNRTNNRLQIFWITSNENTFKQESSCWCNLTSNIINSGFINYTIDLSNMTTWRGIVNQIRIDPGDGLNLNSTTNTRENIDEYMDLEYIKFSN